MVKTKPSTTVMVETCVWASTEHPRFHHQEVMLVTSEQMRPDQVAAAVAEVLRSLPTAETGDVVNGLATYSFT